MPHGKSFLKLGISKAQMDRSAAQRKKSHWVYASPGGWGQPYSLFGFQSTSKLEQFNS